MLQTIKDTLSISDNTNNIKSNCIMTDTLLNKISFLEVETKNNKDDIKYLEEKIEELEEDNLELKGTLSTVSINYMKYSSYQRQLIKDQDKKIEDLNNKLNNVLKYIENNPIVNTNNIDILHQVDKVDMIAKQIFRLKPTKKKKRKKF